MFVVGQFHYPHDLITICNYNRLTSCELPSFWEFCEINYSKNWLRHKRDRVLCVVITEENNVTIDSEELIVTTEYLTL